VSRGARSKRWLFSQFVEELLSVLDRLECLSLCSAFASIWRCAGASPRIPGQPPPEFARELMPMPKHAQHAPPSCRDRGESQRSWSRASSIDGGVDLDLTGAPNTIPLVTSAFGGKGSSRTLCERTSSAAAARSPRLCRNTSIRLITLSELWAERLFDGCAPWTAPAAASSIDEACVSSTRSGGSHLRYYSHSWIKK